MIMDNPRRRIPNIDLDSSILLYLFPVQGSMRCDAFDERFVCLSVCLMFGWFSVFRYSMFGVVVIYPILFFFFSSYFPALFYGVFKAFFLSSYSVDSSSYKMDLYQLTPLYDFNLRSLDFSQ